MSTTEHLQASTPSPDVATLTLGEAAALLRVHPATIRRWIEAGRLAAYQVRKGGTYRIARSSVDQLLDERRVA